jgi:hypothetical protein
VQLKQLFSQRQPQRTQPHTQRPGESSARPVSTGTVRRRLGLLNISLFFVVWVVLICGRLVWLQVIHH